MSTIDFGDPLRDVVEKVPIVGDGENGAGVLRQELLEPQHTFGVEVVGGFVEQKQVGLLKQQLCQCDAAFLTAGEIGDGCIAWRCAEGVHRLLELRVQVPGIRRVDLLLQRAHLGEQGVEVGVGLGHGQRDLVETVDLLLDRADSLLHVLEHRLRLVELGLLHQDADAVAGAEACFAVARGVEARHDLQDR